MKMFEEAAKELRKSTERKQDGMAHLFAGRALAAAGHPDEALEECLIAVRVAPHLADTHLGVAEVLVARGRATEAVPYLREAARLALPQDTRAIELLKKTQTQDK
jgi:tetratricopeptide (TPR) repeat protein